MNKIKVLHVITFLSDAGGAEKLQESLLPRLKDGGIDVDVAVLCELNSENERIIRDHGINIIKVGEGKSIYSPLKMMKLLPIMRNYDIVHTHLTAPFFFAAFNKYFCNVKLVNTIHNTDSKCRHYPLLRTLEKWALKKYDTLISCSKDAETSLLEFIGKVHPRSITINNGVELCKFINAERSEDIPKETVNITMVAIFRKQKDQTTLIRATKLLPDNYHTYFVGWGSPEMEEAQKLTKELTLTHRVHFLGKRTDVPQILKSSDFVVLSSHYEGLSLASIEAMASGAPFIASDVPGLHELVNGYGELFEEGNEKQLAETILKLSNNKTLNDQVVKKCIERAMQFDISVMADSYINEYKRLMA